MNSFQLLDFNFDCFTSLSDLYSSLKKTWTLSEIYQKENLKGIKNYQEQYPEEFCAFLNQKIRVVGSHGKDAWIKPGYLIARYGPSRLFEYIAQFIKEEPVHSNDYTLLHAITPILDKHIREPRIIYLIENDIIKNVNALDKYRRSCLFYLRNCGHILDFLIQHGIDFNIVDIYGVCPTEYRYLSSMFDHCPFFYKENSELLLKRALEVDDTYLVSLVMDHVDISNWPFKQRLKVRMLRALNLFYTQEAATYLIDVIPHYIFANGPRLFNFIDDYLSNTFGAKSLPRKNFIFHGLHKQLLEQYDTQVVCFLKFTDLLLQRKRYSSWWHEYFVDVKDFYHHVPNRLEYARKFQNLHPIKDDRHWLYILNWLYVCRNDNREEYHRLLKRLVELRDVSNNTVLHFIAKYDMIVKDQFLAYKDLEWVRTSIIKMGADIDAVNEDKETPLFAALQMCVTSWEDTRNFCRLLIEYGAHLDVINKKGEKMEHLLKSVLGLSFISPRPLQCLAARKCKKSPLLPKVINKIIDLH